MIWITILLVINWIIFGFQRVLYDTSDENNGFKILEVLCALIPIIGFISEIGFWIHRHCIYADTNNFWFSGKHLNDNKVCRFIYNSTFKYIDEINKY